MGVPYYRVTVKLDLVSYREPDSQGYVRTDVADLAEVTLTGGTEQNVLNQAYQHIGILVTTYSPVSATKTATKVTYQ